MPALRLLIVLSTLALLAGCGQNGSAPPPPSEAQPATPQPTPAAAAPAAGDATAPLFGSWAADLARCGSDAIRITSTSFEGAGNTCDITALEDNGDGTFTASLSCAGEGQRSTEAVVLTPVFAPTGEGVTVVYSDRGGERATLLRCSR